MIIDEAGMVWDNRVALRKESVDRNYAILVKVVLLPVALRKESVDRNVLWVFRNVPLLGRSPQGERG